jgi:hypothetical protein
MRTATSLAAAAAFLMLCALWSFWSIISTLHELPKESAALLSQSSVYDSATYHQRDDLSTIQRLGKIGANDGSNRGNDHTTRKLLAEDKNTHSHLWLRLFSFIFLESSQNLLLGLLC